MPNGRPEPVAHSAPRHDPGRDPQPYRCHVDAVVGGAKGRAEAVIEYAVSPPRALLLAIVSGATFHDLGKLDDENQTALRAGRDHPLRWDHVDAGIAHLLAGGDKAAAWLVRAHHRPGLVSSGVERALTWPLRGTRERDPDRKDVHRPLVEHVDARLAAYVAEHERVCGQHPLELTSAKELHGLAMRLALSCLVDADHTDSASYDAGVRTPMPNEGRIPTDWSKRLARLKEVAAEKARDAKAKGRGERVGDRTEFLNACLDAKVSGRLARCEGPVGIGKTLGVTANLLQHAADEELRHIIVVAPYTNIITQTVKELRAALVLPGENPEEVVAEHHHRADFSSQESRDLATLWRAPVIVTTAVQFFETLASNEPARLRKLHELPGSAVFLDEAHAAIPAKLWPQNWRWMRELAERWGCRFVFASGSLARFWEMERIMGQPLELPELVQTEESGRTLHARLLGRERDRVRYEFCEDALTVGELYKLVRKVDGPRLVILNTVQTAAVVAERMRKDGEVVLHLSTALCPRDRTRMLRHVLARLRLERMIRRCAPDGPELKRARNWTLVATSCVEAGVDLSFATAFRERASAASLIQVGGRVNRHRERDTGVVYDFAFAAGESGVTENRVWKAARRVLEEMWKAGAVNGQDPAEVVTEAIRREVEEAIDFRDCLGDAEVKRSYPDVAVEGRVIGDDSVFVVIDPQLHKRLEKPGHVPMRDLLEGSVQMHIGKVEQFSRRKAERPGWGAEQLQATGLVTVLPNRPGIFAWNADYDPEFLGYMAGVFQSEDLMATGIVTA